jgi:hypothetical protein
MTLMIPTLREISIDQVGEWLSVVIKQDDASKKILFLLSLLTYTDSEQPNVAMKGEAASGKSWIAGRIVDLHPEKSKKILAYASPTAFFHEQEELDNDTGRMVINYERKILLFLDMPHAQLLERLRPLLSHDEREITYKVTDSSQKHGFRTKEKILRGFFTTVFCSADSIYGEQEQTRMVFLSPSDDQGKLREALLLKAEREQDPEAFRRKMLTDTGLSTLRERISTIEHAHIRNVVIPNAPEVTEDFLNEHAVLLPRHTRDLPRLMSLIKASAVLNFSNRNFNKDHDITTNETDVAVGKELYRAVAESNEIGLDPATHDVWTDIIQPLLKKDGWASETKIAKAYFIAKHRSIGDRRLRRTLTQLETTGLVAPGTDPRDRRSVVYKLVNDDR